MSVCTETTLLKCECVLKVEVEAAVLQYTVGHFVHSGKYRPM